jgi:hypothetical protein
MNMRKYLLPSAICLLLGLGLGFAQSINKAIQLSPDTTALTITQASTASSKISWICTSQS